MKSKFSIIFTLLVSFLCFPQTDIKIISSDRNSIVIEYTPVFTDTLIKEINSRNYIQLELNNGYVPNSDEWGIPAVPVRELVLGVPSEFGNSIQVLNSSYREIDGAIAPNPKMIRDNNLSSYSYEISPEYNNYSTVEELVSFGEFGVMRNIPIHSFKVHPIKFFPNQNKIRLFNKIIFRINFSASQKINSDLSDNFLQDVLINFDVAKYWAKPRPKKLGKISTSVLNSGKWVKFEAPEEGIYRITYSMLSTYGIDPAAVDPRTIKIYNNGGKVLPESQIADAPTDLIENAIMVIGEEDGVFNEGDYILFYGRGINFWDYDSTVNKIRRYFHPYSKENFYWITSGGNDGKRIQSKPSLNESNKFVQSSTKAFANWEVDILNFGKTGRVYVGDVFNDASKSRTYTNLLSGRIPSVPVQYDFHFINASRESFNLRITENSNQIFNQNFSGYGPYLTSNNYEIGTHFYRSIIYYDQLPENRSVLRFEISSSSVSPVGFLDYFEIQYQKYLTAFNDNLIAFSLDTTSIVEYKFSGFSSTNIKVFDVTDFSNVRSVSNFIMISGGECQFQAMENEGRVSKYFAVGSDNYRDPVNPVEIQSQNLTGEITGAKYIIITHKNFLEQASRLKNYRENESLVKISTIVTDVEKIYNEFSGGLMDVSAIRNYIKYAYNNWSIQPEYALLFGDGTYDYKNTEGTNNNFIPSYQVPLFITNQTKLDFLDSNPMDDYYVRVDGINPNDAIIDLTIGRITVQSLSEAEDIIDKIIEYEQNPDKGTWNQLVTLVADDGLTTEGNDGSIHHNQSESLASGYIPNSYNLKKIYLAAYPTVITGAGRTKPGVNRAIISAINEETLMVNYVGHGNEEVWAHERVFENSSTIPQLHNNKYFFLTAPTCTFGYFDLPSVQSGAELLLLKSGAGIIGSFAACRPVFSGENHTINTTFYNNIFNSSRDTLNLPITIGKAYLKTKTYKNPSKNDNKFLLFGDPVLRLALPQYSATVDSVNGKNLTTPIQISALSSTTVEGKILTPENCMWEDFNGEGILSVFDSQRSTRIIEPIDTSRTNVYNTNYQGGIIFKGRISINNGSFNSNFVVPKDISYNNQNGKIVVYFYNNNSDGIGYTNNIIIGGTDSSIVNDGNGPKINIHFDNESYENNYLINPNSTLIVKLSDETGINTTGTGVGHRLEGIINGKTNEPIDFTQYFTGDLDAGGKSGEIRYPFNNLEPGEYNIEIKAWDVFNNFSTENAYFNVVDGNDLVIRDIYNYPNPFSTNTTFTFQHNLNRGLDLQIKVYTIAGRLIREIDKKNINDGFVKVDWDGRDQDGSPIANGTYLYKIIVKTIDGEFSKSVLGKLAVIR